MEFTEIEINKFSPSDKPVFIDADSMLYYSTLRVGEDDYLSDDEAFDVVKNNFLELVKLTREACNSSGKTLYFFSCARASNYRLHFSPEYKANRNAKIKPKFVEQLKDHVTSSYSNAILCTNVEADDAVAYMHKLYKGDCIICSPDKDVLKQLPGEHFDYRKQAIVATTDADARRFLFLQMLAGDSTDGIKGLPKVGLKVADKLLSACPSFAEVVRLYNEKGLSSLDAKNTAYLVDISRIDKAEFVTSGKQLLFKMESLNFIY